MGEDILKCEASYFENAPTLGLYPYIGNLAIA